ncbi:MAG: leucine-rich repeat domain-containing protein, partial [Gammaproteobacteria bacterium]|nr:leucine-rich repeat domain-containing protein [Gammaproteobacteria bacterium]
GTIALGVVALALAACSEAGPQPSAAATPTDRLAAEVTPAGCGTVTAQQTSDTSTPSPATEWTFPDNAYVRVAATANAGCTFVRWELLLGDSFFYGTATNPLQFQLVGDMTAKAHFSGTPSTAPTPTATATATATATSTPAANACTETTLGVDPATNSGLAADCAALLAAKAALADAGTLDWSADTAMTDWDGMTLGGTPQRVTGLSLMLQGVAGAIPKELGGLTALRTLNLSWNKLLGAIPTELGSLTELRSLDLSRNRLTGGIPSALGGLTKLEQLTLSQNFLDGSIPAGLGGLANLEGLYLYQNRLTESIPPELENLSSLTALFLGENELGGCVPRALRTVANNDLATLELPSCPLPATTLSYDSYDTTGAVATAGSYAFLTEGDDGATTAVSTYEGLRDGTASALLIHKSDAGGTSRATVYDMVEAGDLFEWKEADDCFVRYTVTEVKPDPAGTVPRKSLAVEWMTYAFTGCSGAVSTDTDASVTWGALADLGGTSLTAPVVHGPFQIVPPDWTGVVMPGEIHELPEGAPEYPGPVATTESLTVARHFPYWRDPALPAGWTFSSARSGGYDVSYGYCAMYVSADGYPAVRVCGEHAWDLRWAEDSSWVASDGREGALQVVIETRRIDGRPALVAYSPLGPRHSDSFTVRVRVFDAATQSLYSISGFDPTLLGGNVEGLIAIVRSLFKSPNSR